MSHIAEVYAKDLGVKIGQPYITDHFFPGLPDKYITLHSSNKMPAAIYKHWDIVVKLIRPYLQSEDIKIVQIGGPKEQKISGIDCCFLEATYKQMNHIIKRAVTHAGCDSLPGHIASAYDIPSVILHFNLYPENSKPRGHKKSKCVSVSPDFSEVKPSYSTGCDRINEIKPEIIAQNILDQLGIYEKIKFKTVRVGSDFHKEIIEIIPNFSELSDQLKGQPVNIRGDIHWDLENIVRWCQFSLVSLHLSSVFDVELLNHMPNLKQVIFHYEGKNNSDITNFLKALKNNKINIIIQAENCDDIADIRLRYFDYNVIETKKPHEYVKATKFISKKSFVTEAQVFNSESSAKRLDKTSSFVYDEASSKELESLYLYDEE